MSQGSCLARCDSVGTTAAAECSGWTKKVYDASSFLPPHTHTLHVAAMLWPSPDRLMVCSVWLRWLGWSSSVVRMNLGHAGRPEGRRKRSRAASENSGTRDKKHQKQPPLPSPPASTHASPPPGAYVPYYALMRVANGRGLDHQRTRTWCDSHASRLDSTRLASYCSLQLRQVPETKPHVVDRVQLWVRDTSATLACPNRPYSARHVTLAKQSL